MSGDDVIINNLDFNLDVVQKAIIIIYPNFDGIGNG